MADENVAAISDESKTMLEEHVKKGKARKFVLISKGSQIKTLIVFKKGAFGPKLKAAKKAGFRGEVTCGIITGRGISLTLQLPGTAEVSEAMKTEGNVYDEDPCKVAKLRAFLLDEAGLKVKPEFLVVRSIEDVATVSELDDEEEDAQAETAVEDLVDAALKAKLVEALKKMTALIQQAVAANPQRREEILAPAARIKEHLIADSLEDAKQGLLSYKNFLQELLSQSAASDSGAPPPPPPPPPGSSGEEASPKSSEWDWRLAELTPRLKQVLGERLGDFGQVATLFKEARAIREQDVDQAVELLKRCATLVDDALKMGAAAEEELADAGLAEYRESWEAMVAEFPAQRRQVITNGTPDQLIEFERLMAQAEQLATRNEFQAAVEIALKIADLATAAARTATAEDLKGAIPERIVEERKAFVLSHWQEAIRASHAAIEKIAAPIAEQVPDEDPAFLVRGITDALDEFVDELNDAILGVQAASSKDPRPLDQARKTIQSYRSKINADALIHQLDDARKSLGVEVDVRERLLSALDELESRLAG